MKRYTFDFCRMILIALLILAYVGCKKNDNVSDQPTVPAGSSLAEILCNGSSKTWNANECLQTIFVLENFTFKNDSTVQAFGEIAKWGVLDASTFFIEFAPEFDSFCNKFEQITHYYRVASYSSESITFSSIEWEELQGNDCKQTKIRYDSSNRSCVIGIVKKP